MRKNVIFDLDGTLTQSEEGIWKCVQYAAEKMGFADPRKAWAEETGYAYDRSRLVIAGICAESAARLDRLGVHWEMYDGDRLVLLPPVGFGSEEEARLLDALHRGGCGRRH